MKKHFNLYIAIALLGFISSCAPTLEEFEPSKGSADFSQYIAVGNSLTSGYADGGLYLAGQKVAFPNLMAEQFKSVGGGEFNSPFFTQDQENGSGYIRLKSLVEGNPVTEAVTDKLAIRGTVPGSIPAKPLYTKYLEPIQNLGVPGMRLDMAFKPGIGSIQGNPFFERLLADEVSLPTKYVDYASEHDHTFFSLWLGNNDVLGYATNGAAASDDPTKILISTAAFEDFYTQFVDALTQQEQKGVVATIPDVSAVPFLNTVTTARLNAAVDAASEGQVKNVFIATKTGARIATEEDLFILTFPTALLGQPDDNQIPYGMHPQNPIADQYVLDKAETKEVVDRIKEINKKIIAIAQTKDLAVADVYTFMNKVKAGYTFNGFLISSAFITGNAFSMDGIHLTPIGNALVANLFIEAINKKYKAKIGKVDVNNYHGVLIPNGQ